MSFYLLLIAVIVCMGMSMRTLFITTGINQKRLTSLNLLYLGFIYVTIVLGFGLIYMLFQLKGWMVLVENGQVLAGSFFYQLETSFYFSAITLFSVGYGDVVPEGAGRIIAITEALVGYTIPSAFVARTVFDFRKK